MQSIFDHLILFSTFNLSQTQYYCPQYPHVCKIENSLEYFEFRPNYCFHVDIFHTLPAAPASLLFVVVVSQTFCGEEMLLPNFSGIQQQVLNKKKFPLNNTITIEQ
jgi:hypothetical protein